MIAWQRNFAETPFLGRCPEGSGPKKASVSPSQTTSRCLYAWDGLCLPADSTAVSANTTAKGCAQCVATLRRICQTAFLRSVRCVISPDPDRTFGLKAKSAGQLVCHRRGWHGRHTRMLIVFLLENYCFRRLSGGLSMVVRLLAKRPCRHGGSEGRKAKKECLCSGAWHILCPCPAWLHPITDISMPHCDPFAKDETGQATVQLMKQPWLRRWNKRRTASVPAHSPKENESRQVFLLRLSPARSVIARRSMALGTTPPERSSSKWETEEWRSDNFSSPLSPHCPVPRFQSIEN